MWPHELKTYFFSFSKLIWNLVQIERAKMGGTKLGDIFPNAAVKTTEGKIKILVISGLQGHVLGRMFYIEQVWKIRLIWIQVISTSMTLSVIRIAFYFRIQLTILQSVPLNLEMPQNMLHNSKRLIHLGLVEILIKTCFSSTASWLVFQLIVSLITRVGSKILRLTTV